MAVARRHGIGTGQLYRWRHQLLGRRSEARAPFARVALVDEPRRLSGPPLAKVSGLIEIVLPDGTSVRMDAQVDERALRAVLGALRG